MTARLHSATAAHMRVPIRFSLPVMRVLLTMFFLFGPACTEDDEPLATLAVDAATLTFNAVQGGANPAQRVVTITNSRERKLPGLGRSYDQGAGWLQAGLDTNSVGPAATLTVQVFASSLTAGTYSSEIRISSPSASNSPVIAVTLIVTAPPIVVAYKTYGLDLGPYVNGQRPGEALADAEATVLRLLESLRPYTIWLRNYGFSNGPEYIARHAHRLGFKLACGTFLAGGANEQENQREIDRLVNAINASECDLAIVGNETFIMTEPLLENRLIGYISQVRQQTAGVPVTTAQTWNDYLAHPAVIDAVDVVFANFFPYWETNPPAVTRAVATLHQRYLQLDAAARARGKRVYVSEAGHPSCGNVRGESVPSESNAAAYFLNFVSWARALDVPYFYFEAFDEPGKATPQNPQEGCWGVWRSNGQMKPGMMQVFNGVTVPDNWSGEGLIDGPGTPTIQFTHVPARGSLTDITLRGRVSHVVPAQHRVAVYIRVNGSWWTKPYQAAPSTAIAADGSWSCLIVTGGNDQDATQIVAYLIPANINPPVLLGDASLPASLSGYPQASATR